MLPALVARNARLKEEVKEWISTLNRSLFNSKIRLRKNKDSSIKAISESSILLTVMFAKSTILRKFLVPDNLAKFTSVKIK